MQRRLPPPPYDAPCAPPPSYNKFLSEVEFAALIKAIDDFRNSGNSSSFFSNSVSDMTVNELQGGYALTN